MTTKPILEIYLASLFTEWQCLGMLGLVASYQVNGEHSEITYEDQYITAMKSSPPNRVTQVYELQPNKLWRCFLKSS